MPYGTWSYNLIQLGKGTPMTAQAVAAGDSSTAATTLWRGAFGGWDDNRNRQETEENVGTVAKGTRTADTSVMVTVPFQQTTLTYEQVVHLAQAAMGQTTPTGPSPYVYSWAVPLSTTPPTIQPYTLRVGNVQVPLDTKVIPGCWVEELEFSGEADGFWTVTATWKGQRAITGTFTSAIAIPDVVDAIFSNTSLYIDASGGTIGTTQVPGVLLGATIKYTSGIEWVPPGDGVLYPSRIKFGRPKVTYTLKLELEQFSGASVVATQRAAYENNTLQLLRLRCPGPSGRYILWDMAARHTSVGAYEKNGETNTSVTIEGYADYSSADALMYKMDVANLLATIP